MRLLLDFRHRLLVDRIVDHTAETNKATGQFLISAAIPALFSERNVSGLHADAALFEGVEFVSQIRSNNKNSLFIQLSRSMECE